MASRWARSARVRRGHAQNMADIQQRLRSLVDKYEVMQQTLAKDESGSQEAFDSLLHDLKMYTPDPNMQYSTKTLLELRHKDPAVRAGEDLPRLVPAQALWRPRGSPTAEVPSCHPPPPSFNSWAPVFHPGAGEAWQQLHALGELEQEREETQTPPAAEDARFPAEEEPGPQVSQKSSDELPSEAVGAPPPEGPASLEWDGPSVQWAQARVLDGDTLRVDAALCGLWEPLDNGPLTEWYGTGPHGISASQAQRIRDRYMANQDALRVLQVWWLATERKERSGLFADITVFLSKMGREYKAEGNAHYKAKRLDEAIASYDMAIAAEPNELEFHTNKAAALIESNQCEACLELCEDLLERHQEMRVASPAGASDEKLKKVFARMEVCYRRLGIAGRATISGQKTSASSASS